MSKFALILDFVRLQFRNEATNLTLIECCQYQRGLYYMCPQNSVLFGPPVSVKLAHSRPQEIWAGKMYRISQLAPRRLTKTVSLPKFYSG